MITPVVRSLKTCEWPEADREAWQRACWPAIRLRKGGSAAHLKPVSQKDLEQRYGYFLDFIARSAGLDPEAPVCAYVTQSNVDGYLAELKDRVSSVTVYGNISKLRQLARFISPNKDLDWLKNLEQDLDWDKRPQSKFDRIVYSDRLVQAGIVLMEEADAAHHLSALKRARAHRNGLMIALLAVMPIRLKNFAALEIDRHLVNYQGKWHLRIPEAETKSRRSDERVVPHFLSGYLGKYISTYRLLLNPKSNELWVSGYGGALSYSGCENIVTETTRSTLGVPVSPHLFRSSAASTAYLHAGNQPHLATALLHHTDRKTTELHYNRARGSSYASLFSKLIKSFGE